MSNEVMVALIGASTTVLVAIGGWVFAWMLSRDSKKNEALHTKIEALTYEVNKLQNEVNARIAVETVSNQLIAELEGTTERAAMLKIRKSAEEASGLRPRLSPSEVVKDPDVTP